MIDGLIVMPQGVGLQLYTATQFGDGHLL